MTINKTLDEKFQEVYKNILEESNLQTGEKMNIDKTLDEREVRYGKFSTQANLSQVLKRSIMTHHNWWDLSPDKREALEMILHKVARILNGNADHADSWHDIAGYAVLVERELNEEDTGDSDRREHGGLTNAGILLGNKPTWVGLSEESEGEK